MTIKTKHDINQKGTYASAWTGVVKVEIRGIEVKPNGPSPLLIYYKCVYLFEGGYRALDFLEGDPNFTPDPA